MKNIIPNPYRLLFVIPAAAAALAGCSARTTAPTPDNPMQLEVKNAERMPIDESAARDSAAMHSFLVGQLAYGREDFKRALDSFSKAGALANEPVPLLHGKLAELYVRSGNLDRALEESSIALQADPESESLLLLQAGILDALNRGKDAEPIYLKAIELHPDSYDAYVLLASIYTKRGDNALALGVLERLVSRAPREPIGHYYIGRFYESEGKNEAAEASYERAAALTPDNTPLQLDLVRAALKNKKFDRARELCGQILEREPGNVAARKVLGQLLIGENKLDEALEHLQVLENVEDDASETRFKIAVIQIEKQNYPEAIRELTLLLAKSPDHSAARYYLGSIYAGSGRRKEAVAELLKIPADDSMFVKSRMFAAFVLRQDGSLDRAEIVVREALKADPMNKSASSYLVLVLRESKKYQAAYDVLKPLVDANPTDDKLLFNFGVVLGDLERKEEAVKVMERVVELNPRYGDALNFVAYHFAEKGRELDRAEDFAKRALETSPNDSYYLDTLGWVYFRKGRLAEAEDALGRAIAVSGGDVVVFEHYGDVLKANQKAAQALDVYRSALEVELESHERTETPTAKRLREKIRAILAENPGLEAMKKPMRSET